MCQNEKLCKDDVAEQVDETHYNNLIGYLIYLRTIGLDFLYAISVFSRFINYANEFHFKVAKRVLRYVKGTLSYGIKFYSSQSFQL